MQLLRQRLFESLLPAPETRQIAAREARQWAAALRNDGSWADIDYFDSTRGPWPAREHLRRLRRLAQVWAGQNVGSPQAALLALDFWIQNDFRNPNWFHNQIGVPTDLGEILIALGSEVSPAQLARGLAIVDRSNLRNLAPNYKTGANLVWLASAQLMRGVLEKAPDIVEAAFQAIFSEIRVVEIGEEGIQSDWSFHQHGALLYSGGYGAGFGRDCARYAALRRARQRHALGAFAPKTADSRSLFARRPGLDDARRLLGYRRQRP